VRVYARVLVPPNLYLHTYGRLRIRRCVGCGHAFESFLISYRRARADERQEGDIDLGVGGVCRLQL